MPLTEEQKQQIVDKAVQILRAPDKKQQMEALRQKVMSETEGDEFNTDDAVYSVLQALEELYG